MASRNGAKAQRFFTEGNEENRSFVTIDQFWNIVEEVHHDSGGDMDAKCELLNKRLHKLSLEKVASFGSHFRDCFYRAYTWELWAAAYIIGGGCSDDAFSDFRSTLISMGRDVFEKALADPQWLADIDYDAEQAHYEGYQYVPFQVYRDLNGGQKKSYSSRPHPREPSGQRWDEDKLAVLYPKLAKHFDNRPRPTIISRALRFPFDRLRKRK